MRRSENSLDITLRVPDNFTHMLKRSMEKEVKEASRKWKVDLTSEQKKEVLQHAENQLIRKVSFLCKKPWTMDDEYLTVSVNTLGRGSATVLLPDDGAENYEVSIVRVNDEWQMSTDPNSDLIPITKFSETIFDDVDKWAKTAVFYGVGSYSTN